MEHVNNLSLRILTALLLAPLVVALIFNSSIGLTGLLLVLIGIGLIEFLKLAQTQLVNKLLSSIVAILVLGLVLFKLWQPFMLMIFPIALLWWLNNIWTITHYPNSKPRHSLLFFNTTLLFVPLLGLQHLQTVSPAVLLLLCLIVWGADSCAYFVGKAFGKHKLAPKLSSGKTVEGVVGGVVGAVFITFIWMLITDNLFWQFIPIALITTLFSVVGDLYESIYKREAGVKDSGNILPGHGGLLDRIDGLLAATPIFIIALVISGLMQ